MRDHVRTTGDDVRVFAGCVMGQGEHEVVGPNDDIWVPPAFFKVLVKDNPQNVNQPEVLAFLFPHHRTRHGDVEDFLTSVDVIEALTGLDFFPDLSADDQHAIEDPDTFDNWAGF